MLPFSVVHMRLVPFSFCTAYNSCTIHKLKESEERRIKYGHYSNIQSEIKLLHDFGSDHIGNWAIGALLG